MINIVTMTAFAAVNPEIFVVLVLLSICLSVLAYGAGFFGFLAKLPGSFCHGVYDIAKKCFKSRSAVEPAVEPEPDWTAPPQQLDSSDEEALPTPPPPYDYDNDSDVTTERSFVLVNDPKDAENLAYSLPVYRSEGQKRRTEFIRKNFS